MTLFQILTLLGVPSMISIIIGFLFDKLKSKRKQDDALKLGLQALLRSQLINDFNRWSQEGYAPIYARENFDNCWKQYHSLGANGVMDDIYKKFMALPTEQPI